MERKRCACVFRIGNSQPAINAAIWDFWTKVGGQILCARARVQMVGAGQWRAISHRAVQLLVGWSGEPRTHACAAYTYGKGIQGDVTLVHPHVSNHLRPGQARCAHGQGHAQRYASTATPPATRRRQHPTQGCEATF